MHFKREEKNEIERNFQEFFFLKQSYLSKVGRGMSNIISFDHAVKRDQRYELQKKREKSLFSKNLPRAHRGKLVKGEARVEEGVEEEEGRGETRDVQGRL